jgi:peptide/nickel transport system substrate-binding protein
MSELEHKLKLALDKVGRGKVSRREFIQLALAAGLTVGAADMLFTTAARAQAKSGGYARFGLAHGATTDNLDPASWPDTFTQTAFGGGMSNNLTEVDAKGNVQPELAESFEAADGAKKWVFKLRSGVTFHDGKPLTPEDVIASIRHHMGEGSKSAAKSLLEAVADIQA